jgi:thioredoxin reductase (NADPH)
LDQEKYDIAIVGCGPAGMSAALNAKIRNKKFILLGTHVCAGKLEKSPQVDNYLGMPKVPGKDMKERFLGHLSEMEIVIEQAKITAIYPGEQGFSLVSSDKFYEATSIIICTGVAPTNLIPGEANLIGSGASYCATCDGPLYKGKKVALIAYSPEAEEEANYLAGICQEVLYIPQYKDVGKLDQKVDVKRGKPTSIVGDQTVTHVEVDGENISIDGVFILRDTMPAERLLQGLELKEGAIFVDREMATNLKGAFAAGDCTGKPWQIAKAVGEGATAALSAVKYLDGLSRNPQVEG